MKANLTLDAYLNFNIPLRSTNVLMPMNSPPKADKRPAPTKVGVTARTSSHSFSFCLAGRFFKFGMGDGARTTCSISPYL